MKRPAKQAFFHSSTLNSNSELRTDSVARYVLYTSAASLMKVIKTPPPSLLRARFATVLEPFRAFLQLSPLRARPKRPGFPSFYANIYGIYSKRAKIVHSDSFCVSLLYPIEQCDLTTTGNSA